MNWQMEREIHDLSVVTSTRQRMSMNLCSVDDLELIDIQAWIHMYIYCKVEYDRLALKCTYPILLHKCYDEMIVRQKQGVANI